MKKGRLDGAIHDRDCQCYQCYEFEEGEPLQNKNEWLARVLKYGVPVKAIDTLQNNILTTGGPEIFFIQDNDSMQQILPWVVLQWFQFNNIARGPANHQYVGNKVRLLHLTVRIQQYVNFYVTAINEAAYYRLVVVYDREQYVYNTAPKWSDVFQDQDVYNRLDSDAYSQPNLRNANRFLILKDHVCTSPNSTDPARQTPISDRAAQDYRPFQSMLWEIPLGHLGLESVIPEPGSAFLGTGALYFLSRSTEQQRALPIGSSVQFEWAMKARCYYSDNYGGLD